LARALIEVAIDGRRLGHPLPIPYTLFERAARGYLDDHDWDQAGEDWLEQTLAYTATPRHGEHPSGGQPRYRLANYSEQTGRADRAGVFPPAAFRDVVATTVTEPGVLRELGQQAE
jgi:hypothetical protein